MVVVKNHVLYLDIIHIIESTPVLIVFQCASSVGVRVLIDAEQSYLQPAIEHLVLYYMMKKFNHTHPVIYNTAQAYLTVSVMMALYW